MWIDIVCLYSFVYDYQSSEFIESIWILEFPITNYNDNDDDDDDKRSKITCK